MPCGVHAQQGSHAAAQEGGGHEGGFRDPPQMFFGFQLVCKHKQEGNGIDYQQVDEDEFFHE